MGDRPQHGEPNVPPADVAGCETESEFGVGHRTARHRDVHTASQLVSLLLSANQQRSAFTPAAFTDLVPSAGPGRVDDYTQPVGRR
jgi:hypothetical protein